MFSSVVQHFWFQELHPSLAALRTATPPAATPGLLSQKERLLSTAQGDTISVTPASTLSETLVCKAEDAVSHVYISTNVTLRVASM